MESRTVMCRRITAIAVCFLHGLLAVPLVRSEVPPEVAADWRRHDEQLLAEVLTKGAVRFPSTILDWPGAERALPVLTEPASNQPQALPIWILKPLGTPTFGFGKNELVLEFTPAATVVPPVELEIQTVVLTRRQPVQQTVLRQNLGKAARVPVTFTIDCEGAAAVVVHARRGGKAFRAAQGFLILPLADTLERAERLAADAQQPAPVELGQLKTEATSLAAAERQRGPQPAERQRLYLAARELARTVALATPALQFDQLLLVKRYTQQTYPDVCLNHMPWCSRPGGDICVVSPPRPEGSARPLIAGQLGPGHVHGMDLWYDGDRVVFGYAKRPTADPAPNWLDRAAAYHLRRTEEPTHLFEIRADGTHLRQLTTGPWSDLDPAYLPSGDVVFVSERCGYSLQCNEMDKDETSCNLYVMRGDGTRVKRLSVTKDGDYLPHVLDNGLIAYTRWEYQERLWAFVQSIWTIRPDGTAADALFKQHFNDPWAFEDVRSVPASRKLVAVATGHHTLAAGPVVLVDPHVGINNPGGIGIVTPGVLPPEGGMSGTAVPQGGVRGIGGFYQTPWALSETQCLVSYTYGSQQDEKGYAIYLVDVYGGRELIYRDPAISCSIPIPLRPRHKPPVLWDSTDPSKDYATCMVTNVYEGLEGVKPGTIKYLRVSARSPWPYDNDFGGQRYEPDVKAVMINWTPARVIGTVPVEADGSAHFRVPVDTAVYFQALDENHMEVRRMRSFISFQPGEVRGCTGCHETRANAAANVANAHPLAMTRPAVIPTPPPWGTTSMSFLRDVQPVLDRHCAGCHGGVKPAGDADLTGGLTASYNRAWETINVKGLVSRSNVGDDAKITPPYAFGSHKSKLIAVLKDQTHQKIRLDAEESLRLVTWIDLNAPYHASFINKRGPTVYNLADDGALQQQLFALNQRRCGGCHQPKVITRLDWIDLRRPASSRFLAAPLAPAAGGSGSCTGRPYASAADPDFRAVLDLVTTAVRASWRHPRRDLEDLEPPAELRLVLTSP